MAIPRPKILTRVTVPTGGWSMDVKISASSTLDTTITLVIDANDYFVSGDNQTDCFIHEFISELRDAIIAALGAPTTTFVIGWIDNTTHKVKLGFEDDYFQTNYQRDVSLVWDTKDGPSIAAVLGFDSSAADTSTGVDNPVFTGAFPHAYGWYANDDMLLSNLLTEDINESRSLQARSFSGKAITQDISQMFRNTLDLQWIPHDYMFSRDIGYGVASLHPYTRNQGLECWWEEARKGVEFRVYRDAFINTARANTVGEATGSNTTTVTDSNKSFGIEPVRWKGGILYSPLFGANTNATQSWHVSTNSATVITVSTAAPSAENIAAADATYYLFDHQYQTYVVDTQSMQTFAPLERPNVNKYDLSIPLFRYVA